MGPFLKCVVQTVKPDKKETLGALFQKKRSLEPEKEGTCIKHFLTLQTNLMFSLWLPLTLKSSAHPDKLVAVSNKLCV